MKVKKERIDTQAGTACGLAQSQAVPGPRTFKLSREIGALQGLTCRNMTTRRAGMPHVKQNVRKAPRSNPAATRGITLAT